MADHDESPPITKCPPGAARNATLHHWQFGVKDQFGVRGLGPVWRLAKGEFTAYEKAVLEAVAGQPGDISQVDLQAMLKERLGVATKSQVYQAAQRLAKHGMIGRNKVKREWRYAKPGFSWRAPKGER